MTTHHPFHFVSVFVFKFRWPVYFPVGENTPRAQTRGVRQDHPQAEWEPQRQSGHYLCQRGRHQVSVGWAPMLTTLISFESPPHAFPITNNCLCSLIIFRFLQNLPSHFCDEWCWWWMLFGNVNLGLPLQLALKCQLSPACAKNMITCTL